jgi:hypothetical protein
MKKLVITLVMAIVLFGGSGIAEVQQHIIVPTPDEAFVNIVPLMSEFGLGTTSFPGVQVLDSALTIRVESNCLHGSILAATEGFRRPPSGFIPPQRISIKSQVTNGFVPMEKPVVISKTEFGNHDIVLNFKVLTGVQDPEGRYTGTLILTLMPPI